MGNTARDENERIRRFIALDKNTLPADGGSGFNRLIFATSPYLLQHADNPVDWHPWGEEAFAAARREHKPVFLSIGYATCHWCHVMAHESFEDGDVAAVLNRDFIPVKVDREERPDIDAQYMTVAQMMTGSGGWPLTIVMTPDREPFFAATYLPRTARMGMPGIITVLDRITHFWRTEPDRVAENCAAILENLGHVHRFSPGPAPAGDVQQGARRQLEEIYDQEWGGFGDAPKFPMPFNIMFLLRCWRRNGDRKALEMVEHTLRKMREGGIFDQIGYGFHRYSVDRQWLVPHFEKMLYDQALLSMAYVEAWKATGDIYHLNVAEEVFTYVLREMAAPEGGFFSALDADSEGEEGKFYVWTPGEIRDLLGEDAGLFCRLFDVTERGNFEESNVLHLPAPLDEAAKREGLDLSQLNEKVALWCERLLAVRERRIRPFRDEKILSAWNGMMIASLAAGYAATGKQSYLTAAESAAIFIARRLVNGEGRLMRSFHLGRGVVPGFLEDYAAFAWGLSVLYEVTGKSSHLDLSEKLCHEILRLFRDRESGLCYDTGSDTEEILLRISDSHDGVVPSGNSLAAYVLCKVGKLTGDLELQEAGRAIMAGVMGKAARQPTGHLALLIASDADAFPIELTVAGKLDEAATRALVLAVGKLFLPGLVIRFAGEGDKAYSPLDGRPAFYLCAAGRCRPPVVDLTELERLLAEVA
ncbi:thioredoxin domain-containing protein [Geobacter sp. DSM 9736]|uniref:thioredoxin domain-containing protein n=1 Tax=Geobacter sp. DSM 9736 TaxID=1277350 RepID=UPI000B504FBF|nr:thioredoxin domain-containing protein [Geobacter sp. DSM 9736]SNB44965.1 hypothetical protein SAMN06269301_0357 [Geobacter sp. DSM 9736]